MVVACWGRVLGIWSAIVGEKVYVVDMIVIMY